MRKLLGLKKRDVSADENLGSAGTAKNTAEHGAKKTMSDTETLADQNSKPNPRIGVSILHEPSDPTAAVVE